MRGNERPEDQGSVALILPISTIMRVFAAILALVCLKILAPLLMTLILAILLAVSLYPILTGLIRLGIPKSTGVTVMALALAGGLMAISAAVVPRLVEEFSIFIANLPQLKNQVLNTLSIDSQLRPVIEHILDARFVLPKTNDLTPFLNAGNFVLSGVTEVVLILVFSIYLLIDGNGVVHWLSAFFRPMTQAKIRHTREEIAPIIFSYVMGQVITSTLSFIFVFVVLSALRIPNVLFLASLAGIFDVLPVLGFFLSVIPALLFALSISTSTSIFVFGLYVLYHIVENYFIVPAVYGSRLRISSFVVLVALLGAYMLTGIEGAIAVLPIVASYPVVERIWLKKFVGKATVAEHASQDAATTYGN